MRQLHAVLAFCHTERDALSDRFPHRLSASPENIPNLRVLGILSHIGLHAIDESITQYSTEIHLRDSQGNCFLYLFFWDPGSPVKNDRNTCSFGDYPEAVEIEAAFTFVPSMRITDRHCNAIDTRLR